MDTNDALAQAAGDLIRRAFHSRASDIHLEPVDSGPARVRLRIDGILQPLADLPAEQVPGIAERLKAMAGLNPTVSDQPQDGRIWIEIDGKQLDLRVGCVPTVQGERLTARLLDRSDVCLRLEDITPDRANLARLRGLLRRPNGIVLSTGPTGSGKTTTMYSMLMELDREHSNVFSIEDPVEYILPGVSQIAVRPSRGVTFATAARAVLRQDPDVVMIGEIRDTETAHLAVQIALTGHLVLTQLHAATAPGALRRLMDMGLEPFLLNQSIVGVLSQRLARTLCKACRRPVQPDPAMMPPEAMALLKDGKQTFLGPGGCDACHEGYRGRMAIQEILVPDDGVRAAVVQGDLEAIRAAARKAGMRTLLEDGLARAAEGVTSVSEVLRVALTSPHQ
jgi:type II secretory ATPase GspE/PulE/Tfp pilus assembly ATPase PilB-like protein